MSAMTMSAAIAAYDDALDECGDVTIGTLAYAPSRVLREVDPIAYRCGFWDWLDGEGVDGDALEDDADLP